MVMASLCVAAPTWASPNEEVFRQKLDNYVEHAMRKQNIPGLSIAVLHNGGIIVAKGYGEANIEHAVPVTPETIFQSGSIGKMFTAVVVMRLVEQGKMQLDDPLSKYIQDVPDGWRPITIRHLLTHTSGIPNVSDDFDFTQNYTDDELINIAKELPLSFVPGARYSYSNTGYVLLGILLERLTGHPYWETLETDVFEPLGMKTARVISDRDIVYNRAAGYEFVNDKPKNQAFVSEKMNTTADGALYFSLNDMIAWARGVESEKILSSESWEQTLSPVRLNSGKTYPYGFGWEIDMANGHPRYYHGGSWQGFRSYYSRYLSDNLSIVMLANSSEAEGATLVRGIARLWNPALVTPAQLPMAEPEIDQTVKKLIEAARVGGLRAEDVPLASPDFLKYDAPYFVEVMKPLGELTSLDLLERRELGDDIGYTYKAAFGDQVFRVEYVVSPGNKGASFDISGE